MEGPQRPQKPQRPQRPQRSQGNQIDQMNQMNQGYNGQISMSKNQDNGMTAEERAFAVIQERKRKRRKRIFIFLGVIFGIAVLCIGLYFITTGRISSRVVELEAQVAGLEQNIVDINNTHANEVAQLQQEIEDTTVKELVPETSLQRIEGSQVPELWLMEGDFIAPNPLTVPNTEDDVSDSYIQIGSKFVFRPSDQWVLSSQGSTYIFGHPQKIWGKIKSLSVDELVPEENMQKIISDFFVGYPATSITYRDVFIDDKKVGMIGRAEITVKYNVDEETEIEVPVEKEVDVPYEVEEEYEEEVPYTETVTNEDGTTTEVQKTRVEKKTRTVTKTEKKTVTIMEKQTQSNSVPVEKKMIINIGFLEKSSYGLSFLFIYDADGGSNSQELVDMLIRTGAYGSSGSLIKLGQFSGS